MKEPPLIFNSSQSDRIEECISDILYNIIHYISYKLLYTLQNNLILFLSDISYTSLVRYNNDIIVVFKLFTKE